MPATRRKDIVKKLKDFFATRDDVVLAFLFGSTAWRTTRNDSDRDIGVYLAKGKSETDLNVLWMELENLLGGEVDLVCLDHDHPSIAWEALRGIPLVIRDYRFYLEYMLEMSREAEDFQDFIISFWAIRTACRGKPE